MVHAPEICRVAVEVEFHVEFGVTGLARDYTRGLRRR
jgi:hypothetical protein